MEKKNPYTSKTKLFLIRVFTSKVLASIFSVSSNYETFLLFDFL